MTKEYQIIDSVEKINDAIVKVREAQKTFATGFINAGYLAACIRDDYTYQRNQVYQTKMAWEPIFEPDAAMLSGIGDGIMKLNQAMPGYVTKRNIRKLTGIEPDEE